MTLNEHIAKITNTKSILVVVYDNYTLMGRLDDVKNSIKKITKTTGVDIGSLKTDVSIDGSPYGSDPPVYILRATKDEKFAEKDESTDPPKTPPTSESDPKE